MKCKGCGKKIKTGVLCRDCDMDMRRAGVEMDIKELLNRGGGNELANMVGPRYQAVLKQGLQ